jgi:hypothetical protein
MPDYLDAALYFEDLCASRRCSVRVRFQGYSGKLLLVLSISGFDPERTSTFTRPGSQRLGEKQSKVSISLSDAYVDVPPKARSQRARLRRRYGSFIFLDELYS